VTFINIKRRHLFPQLLPRTDGAHCEGKNSFLEEREQAKKPSQSDHQARAVLDSLRRRYHHARSEVVQLQGEA
jgi:hypothetical protein